MGAERKNKHILEITRALLIPYNVPKYLWKEAVLTAVYLINRMPSKVLQFKTPISLLQQNFPQSRLFSESLPLKYLGVQPIF